MSLAVPHHDGSALYVSSHAPGRISLGEVVRLRLRVPQEWGSASRVWVRSVQDGEPRYDAAIRLGSIDGWVWWEMAMLVANPVAKYRFLLEIEISSASGRNYWNLNAQGLFKRDVADSADFRLTTFAPAPQWLHQSTMYQVFPDRFSRSAQADAHPLPDWAVGSSWDEAVVATGRETPIQFYGGDLPGITGKLDHPGTGHRRSLPDALLPGPFQPPLRRLHLQLRGPAPWREPSAGGVGGGGAFAGHSCDG
ncbi:hypothetical protein StoSoilB13_49640 (plasmid) [Arthrobacter sp. StoSoilB13]|nr:hypothetical protein StoSoilB13_49640 [Arthrobacter sp. StoSoilB13]